MSILVIDRDSKGRISAISKQISARDVFPMLAFSILFLVLGALFAAPLLKSGPASYAQAKGTVLALGVAALGLAGVILSLTRMIPGRPVLVRIAGPDGIAFRYFSNLGTVPWSAITGFTLGTANARMLGKEVLVAKLREPEKFSAFSRRDMPVGTIEGCQRLSLAPLQAALEELRRQTAATPAPFAPPPAPVTSMPEKKKGMSFLISVLIPVLVFSVAMAYRQLYGLQALRQIHDQAIGFIILVFVLGWLALFMRKRSRR